MHKPICLGTTLCRGFRRTVPSLAGSIFTKCLINLIVKPNPSGPKFIGPNIDRLDQSSRSERFFRNDN
jgi:hypothetical protein